MEGLTRQTIYGANPNFFVSNHRSTTSMSDRELLRFGQAVRYMCSPAANHGKAPRRVFVIELQEAEERSDRWSFHCF